MATEIDKLAWIHVRDGRVLTARSKGKATLYLPGGKREPGETDAQALAREIREELSVELVPGTLVYAETFRAQADGKPEGTQVKMTCYQADFRGALAPASEIDELVWVGTSDRLRCSPAARLIVDWLAAKGLIT